MNTTPDTWEEEFENLWHETSLAEAIHEFAASEGWENAMKAAPETFHTLKDFIRTLLSQKTQRDIERIEALSMPIGSEGSEKRAYDQALSDVLAALKETK